MNTHERGVPHGVFHLGLPAEQFATAFPFHIAVDVELTIVQVGRSIGRVCPDVHPGVRLEDVFRVERPPVPVTFSALVKNSGLLWLLVHKRSGMQLRGQMAHVQHDEEESVIFLGSPWLTDTNAIKAFGLTISDFALHDPVVDLLQLVMSQNAALADVRKLAAKLSEQRAELREANRRMASQSSTTQALEHAPRCAPPPPPSCNRSLTRSDGTSSPCGGTRATTARWSAWDWSAPRSPRSPSWPLPPGRRASSDRWGSPVTCGATNAPCGSRMCASSATAPARAPPSQREPGSPRSSASRCVWEAWCTA